MKRTPLKTEKTPPAPAPASPERRAGLGRLAGRVGLAVNLALFAAKLLSGWLTGAISVTADAFNNLSDAAGSLLTLAGFHMAGQRPDRRHPFGHGRMEYLAGLGVAVLILLVGLELLKSSVERIFAPGDTALPLPAVILLALSVLAKLGLARFHRSLAQKTGSPALGAAASDALADALATGAVLAALAASRLWDVSLDGWLGLAVALLILRSGWQAARDTADPLLGQPPEPETVAGIESLILAHPPIRGIHDLVIHDYGPGRRMMTVHAEVPADSSLPEIHAVIDRVERELGERFGLEAVIHMDPVEEDDPETQRLRALAGELAREIDPAASVHDLRAEGPDRRVLRFDAVVPYDVPMSDDEIRAALEEKLRARLPGCSPEIRVDRSPVL